MSIDTKTKLAEGLEKYLLNELAKRQSEWERRYVNEYKNSNSMIELDRKNYKSPTQEELKSKAYDSAYYDYDDQLKQLNKVNQNKISGIDESISKIGQDEEEIMSQLEKGYSELIARLDSNNIKRGLGRSSIATEQVKEALFEKEDKANNYRADNANRLNILDDEKVRTKAQLDEAIKDMNIAYAKKLNTTLNALEKEEKRLKDEVIEYNNSIVQQESNLNLNRASKLDSLAQKREAEIGKLIKYEKDYAVKYYGANTPEVDKEYKDRYIQAYNVYASIDKNVALALMDKNASQLSKYLGRYYQTLCKQIKGNG